MFNIAFAELLVIGVVALIVIGPDKLPTVVRTAGVLFGRMQRFTMNIKSEIDKELRTEDLKRLESELRNHDLGLNEELRQGMQPVEVVIQQNKPPLEPAMLEEDALLHPSTALNKAQHVEPEIIKRTEDLQRLESELRNHELGLNEELRQGMQPVEVVIQQNKQPLEPAPATQEDTLLQPSPVLDLNKSQQVEPELMTKREAN